MINLDAPIRLGSASAEEVAMLSDLQGNILKGHGRKATRHLFLKFNDDRPRAIRFVKQVGELVVSAHEQLRQSSAYKIAKVSGGPFVTLFLTFAGYKALGLEAIAPTDAAFREGMRRRAAVLSDPAALDAGYQGDLHALILIGGDPDSPTSWTSNVADDMETKILNLMSEAAEVVASEAGRAIFNTAGEGLEHFGYVDGRSQPLLVVEDIEHEATQGGIDVWSPAFPLSQVLVRDPGSQAATAFGSYFVFRKLEQNVLAFKTAEEALGESLQSGELAGAMLVGRWEDGTAVELSGKDGLTDPISNNFTYATDVAGLRCPIHGHVRKTNPRGESAVKFGFPEADERAHLMARRGITYGQRESIVDPEDRPSGGVGLLFMAYQSDIVNQFEFTQVQWANNEEFLADGTGRDPIIGQEGVSVLIHRTVWNDASAETIEAPFGGFVTFKGGEYFFAPAKSTLANL